MALFFDPLGATNEARADYRRIGDPVLTLWPFVIFLNRSGRSF